MQTAVSKRVVTGEPLYAMDAVCDSVNSLAAGSCEFLYIWRLHPPFADTCDRSRDHPRHSGPKSGIERVDGTDEENERLSQRGWISVFRHARIDLVAPGEDA